MTLTIQIKYPRHNKRMEYNSQLHSFLKLHVNVIMITCINLI
jgi:hypothetical protein